MGEGEDDILMRDLADDTLWIVRRWPAKERNKMRYERALKSITILSSLNHPNIISTKEQIIRTTYWDYSIIEYCHYGALKLQFNRQYDTQEPYSEKIILNWTT